MSKTIFIIGGTGAQGIPVVEALTQDKAYSVRVLTRDATGHRAQKLAALPQVELMQGRLDSDEDLRRGFKGCWGVWINLDGFVIGKKNELYWGIRSYQLAQEAGLKFFVWANLDYSLRDMNYQSRFHCGHMDIKGMVGDFIFGQTKWHDERRKTNPELETTCMGAAGFTTGPYIDMAVSAHTPVAPVLASDGVVEWRMPCTKEGRMPFIALDDCGKYVRWLLDNGITADGKPGRSWGMDLAVVTESPTFVELAAAFEKVTGKTARFVPVSKDEYFGHLEPVRGHKFGQQYSGMPEDDGSMMTFEQNFSGWWQIYGTDGVIKRDFALLDEILPGRIKSAEEWFGKHKDLCERVTKGEHQTVLKLQEDGDRFNKEFDVGSKKDEQ